MSRKTRIGKVVGSPAGLSTLGLVLAACGAACSSSGSPTAPSSSSSSPSQTPITVTFTLKVGSVTASVIAPQTVERKDPTQTRVMSVSAEIVATGGRATIGVLCQLTPTGGSTQTVQALPTGTVVQPGSPINYTRDVVAEFPYPAADPYGVYGCTLSGTDERGSVLNVTRNLSLPVSQTTPVTSTCTPDANTICAFDGRFKVSVGWKSSTGLTGTAAVNQQQRYNDGGWFYYSNPAATDALVQILNRCDASNRYWVFFDATVQRTYETYVAITDTKRGVTRNYTNPIGNTVPLTDTDAFATCP